MSTMKMTGPMITSAHRDGMIADCASIVRLNFLKDATAQQTLLVVCSVSSCEPAQ